MSMGLPTPLYAKLLFHYKDRGLAAVAVRPLSLCHRPYVRLARVIRSALGGGTLSAKKAFT